MDVDMINLANFITSELRAMCIKGKQLYITGNMQRSIATITVNEDYVDIVIATPYASFTNQNGKMQGWIDRTIDRALRCYADNNDVEDLLSPTINYY